MMELPLVLSILWVYNLKDFFCGSQDQPSTTLELPKQNLKKLAQAFVEKKFKA